MGPGLLITEIVIKSVFLVLKSVAANKQQVNKLLVRNQTAINDWEKVAKENLSQKQLTQIKG